MKLLTYSLADGRPRAGVLVSPALVFPAAATRAYGACGEFDSVLDLLAPRELDAVRQLLGQPEDRWRAHCIPLDTVTLHAPIPRPPKILGVATNYHDFCVRGGMEAPRTPKVFAKLVTTVVADGEAVTIPVDGRVTYEGELGVVIGRAGRQISAGAAETFVAGYTVVNDVTAGAYTAEDIQLMRGKNIDTFCPMGPVLVTRDEIADAGNLRVATTVNGVARQESSTANLIFGVAELIEYFSSFLTLERGDVIATGTPAGTAAQHDPPAYLQPGDVVEVFVEGIGSLTNPIR